MIIAKINGLLCAGLLIFSESTHAALIASDNASNYATWGDGDNGGTGFLPWTILSNNDGSTVFAGTFLGDSTAGAGDINTSGNAFGMFANPEAAFMSADRDFSSSLDIGTVFTFQMALNFDTGLKGMKLYAGEQDEVFAIEIGNGAVVSSLNATLNADAGAGYDYGGDDAVLDFMFTMNSATTFSYKISRTSGQGFQGTLFSGTVSDLTSGVSGFGFFVSGTDSNDAGNNLYVNNFVVIPEPSSLLACGLGLMACILRRRRSTI